jgi:predicted nucleic acid-binding protein
MATSGLERTRARRAAACCALIRIDDPVLAGAARVAPAELRTLDAIHLATARSLSSVARLPAPGIVRNLSLRT